MINNMHIYRTFGRTVYLFKIINIYCYNTSEEFFYIKLLPINELFNTFCFGLWSGSELNRFGSHGLIRRNDLYCRHYDN